MARKKNGTAADPERNNFEIADRQNQVLFYHHKRRYRAALADKKEADASFKNACKSAVADLGEGIVGDIKDSIQWEKKGGEAMIKAAFERLARLARWAGFQAGVQSELFTDAPKNPTPADRGYLAGMDGMEPSSPYDPGSAEANEWMAAFHEGTAKINEIIANKDAEDFEADEATGEEAAADGDASAPPPSIGDEESTAQMRH